MRRLAIAFVLALVATVAQAVGLRAQTPRSGGGIHPNLGGGGGGGTPPTLFLYSPGASVTTQYPTIQIEFCKGTNSLNASSRLIKVNGTDVTSSFSYSAGSDPGGECTSETGDASATSSSVALSLGDNSMYGYICDAYNNCASHTWTVTYALRGAPTIALRNQNGSNVDRGLCLTFGAGQAAGIGCGDLFVAHSMPGYRTKGRDRSLTLLYSSSQADPRPAVAAYVTQASGRATPNAMFARLSVGGVVRDSATFYPASVSAPKQVTLAFDGVAAGLSTGIYSFTLLVRNVYSDSTFDATTTGEVLVVNRATSEFGAGWWMSGLEQLVTGQSSNRVLWVAGDGSIAVYDSVAPATWRRAAGGYRDTLTLSASVYTRALRQGIKVQYDVSGHHIRTINRFQDTTRFTWSGSPARLTSITVPPSGASGTTYTLAWDGNGKLDSIADPAGRGINATVTGDTLVSLRDPDTATVTFHYDASHRMSQRVNRRSYTTGFAYGDSLHVTAVISPTSDTTRLRFWDAQGLAYASPASTVNPADTASAYTMYDGPRPNVADTVLFWVDRWGAPIRIRDPLGNISTVTRGDTANPALITLMSAPSGQIMRMSYTARAHLATVTDSLVDATGGTPTNATTTYAYASPDTVDAPISVTDPTSVVTYFYYANGLTTKVVGPDGHRTTFTYNTGALAGLVQSVTDSLVETMVDTVSWSDTLATQNLTTHFHYNGLGNADSIASPSGNASLFTYDSYQRVQYATDPMGHRTQYRYTLMNWPFNVIRRLDDQGGAPDTTYYGYTRNGDIDSLIDPRGVVRRWAYDASDRQVVAWDDFGLADSVYYNRASLPDSVRTRRGYVLRNAYNGAGQQVSTWWPSASNDTPNLVTVAGDSISYTYDAMGRLRTATNVRGSVRRTYWIDGSLRADSQLNASSVQFVNWYRYDLAGRRAWFFNGADTISYAYSSTSGLLTGIHVNWQGAIPDDSLLFTWDGLGRRRAVRYPNGTTLLLHYDRNSRLRFACAYHLTSTFGAGQDGQRFEVRVPSSDRDGAPTRRIQSKLGSSCGNLNGSTLISDDSTKLDARHFNTYVSTLTASTYTAFTYVYDASGNMTSRTSSVGVVDAYALASGVHNQLASWSRNGAAQLGYGYDGAGNRSAEIAQVGAPPDPQRYLFFDAANRMRGFIAYQGGSYPSSCSYDALGRRVNGCDPSTGHADGYDGDNVAQTNDGWRWVHGPGLDDPLLGIFVAGATTNKYYFFTDGSGRHLVSTDTAGSDQGVSGAVASGATARANTFEANRSPSTAATLSGLSFFRNRYYDQNTGRWTQEDPAGPAGGINVYSYVGNNPAAYTDPFGLCPVWLDGKPCIDPVDSPMRPANATTGSGVGGSEWGWTRTNDDGSPKHHNGFDWAAGVGTAIRAPADAMVSYGYDTKGGGNFVSMNLGNGARVNVAHIHAPDGSLRGGSVAAGTVVGYVGTTGNSAGSGREPHGHVVTRVNGKACNPRDFLSASGGGGSCQ